MNKKPHSSGQLRKKLRCAIYARKSSEEGLEQDFNSLDAQREACAAFIASQKHEGWTALQEMYDDGGFSGATMERPAFQRFTRNEEGRSLSVLCLPAPHHWGAQGRGTTHSCNAPGGSCHTPYSRLACQSLRSAEGVLRERNLIEGALEHVLKDAEEGEYDEIDALFTKLRSNPPKVSRKRS